MIETPGKMGEIVNAPLKSRIRLVVVAAACLALTALGDRAMSTNAPTLAQCLSAEASLARAEFGVGEAIGIKIRFRNIWTNGITIRVTEQFNESIVGEIEYSITERDGRARWEVCVDPRTRLSGAPAKVEDVVLRPGEARDTSTRLPGEEHGHQHL